MADISQFYQYCAEGNKEKLKEVIRNHQHQIDINAVKDGNTALHLAIKFKWPKEMTNLLLDFGKLKKFA